MQLLEPREALDGILVMALPRHPQSLRLPPLLGKALPLYSYIELNGSSNMSLPGLDLTRRCPIFA